MRVQTLAELFADALENSYDTTRSMEAVIGRLDDLRRTHLGEWLGVPATGRRFENVDEIYIFQIEDGKLIAARGVEDNLGRLKQLGIGLVPPPD